jgi:transposase
MVLMPESLDDFVGEDNPVRVIDLFVDELDLQGLGFASAQPAVTGRPGYHPGLLLTAVDSRTNPASTAGTAQHDLDLVSG